MNTRLPKSRRTLLLVLVAVGSLLLIWRGFVWHNRSRTVRDAAPAPRDWASWGWGDGRSLSRFRPSSPKPELSNTPALTATNVPLAAPEELATNTQNRWLSLIPPPPVVITAPMSISAPNAVVDLDRLLAAHPPATNSAEARATMVQHIKQIVAARAAAHYFTLVFDISAKDSKSIPFILNADEMPDLTEEVLQELDR